MDLVYRITLPTLVMALLQMFRLIMPVMRKLGLVQEDEPARRLDLVTGGDGDREVEVDSSKKAAFSDSLLVLNRR